MGTSVGTQVFVKFGWRPAAALSVAWSGFTLFVMLIRGPHCARYTWFGYEGGCRLRKVSLSYPRENAQSSPHSGADLDSERALSAVESNSGAAGEKDLA